MSRVNCSSITDMPAPVSTSNLMSWPFSWAVTVKSHGLARLFAMFNYSVVKGGISPVVWMGSGIQLGKLSLLTAVDSLPAEALCRGGEGSGSEDLSMIPSVHNSTITSVSVVILLLVRRTALGNGTSCFS